MSNSILTHIYVISDGGGLLKIGFSTSPKRRLSAVQCGSPRRLSLVREMSVDRASAPFVEAYAHWILKSYRQIGEWFCIDEDTAWAALVGAVDAVSRGERRPRPNTVHGGTGRPKLSKTCETKPTNVRLTADVRERIEHAVGKNRMAAFIRSAVEAELLRLEDRSGGRRERM